MSLGETSRMDVLPFHSKEEVCTKHQERPIELFCQDHEEPCCTMCVSTKHRKCETVEPIEKTATKLKQYFEGKEFDLLLERVEILEDKLMRTKTEQEMCVRQMENTSDRISEETERSFKEVIHHLQSLKNQFLTNMSKGVKKRKESYEKNINSLLDGIHCAQFIKNKLEKSTGSKSAVELTVVYFSGKKCFDRLKKYDFQQLQTIMEEKKPDIFKDIMDLTGVTDVKFLEKTNSVNTDMKKLQLCLISELSMKQKFIRDGTILSSGEFILSTRDTNRYGKDNDECFILNNCGEITKRIKSISKPFGITENENDITINIQPSVKHIISTSSHIVYSNRKTNEVVAINSHGTCTTVWRYSSPGLLSPCGLSVDGDDNIYVAGKESDNVHVLTKDGRCVHVFENITRPDFMKVDKERKLCFVGSMRKYVRVYEML
uniref:B box-type domain-containing protein n=1 Tax=Magallana gigas TaxID=29159 RepID=A0A8W8NXX6_MAGGI